MYDLTDTPAFSVVNFFPERCTAFNDQKTLKIVFDGYLLNKRVLAAELADRGDSCGTKSDAVLMLNLYEKYGKECLQKAKGMFVFAVYDLIEGSVFLARDRAGGKKLYYSRTNSSFVFGPDLKGMLRENVVVRAINKTALAQYLMLSYIPAPLSIIDNVYKLPAAHYMTVSADGHISIEEYWDVVYDDSQAITDYGECQTLLRDKLFQSVEECMYAEPSVGLLLSGGIDSNIIAGIMSRISDKPIETFSIGYKGVKDYDESDRALLSAKFHGSNHHMFFIEYQNIIDNLEKIIENIDEPYADSSYIPTYTISRIAGETVNTVLTGDAGDELFAGYNKYLIGYYSDLYNKVPAVVRNRLVQPIVGMLPSKRSIVRKITKVINNNRADAFVQRRNMMCLGIGLDTINQLLVYDGSKALDFIEDVYHKYESKTCEVHRTLYTDFKIVLDGDMLTKAERTSTLAGITSKAPLLHPDVVALAAKIPAEFKIKGKNRKLILKDTFSDCIPPQIAAAKKKGFAVPVSYWLQNEIKQDLLDTMERSFLEKQGLLNPDYVELLIEEHMSGKKNNAGILWALYIFEKWYRRYFEA